MEAIALTSMTKQRQEAIEQTVKKERGRLFSFIRNRISNPEDAEDLVQDVLFQFVNGFDSISSIDKATSWLFQVARNKIIDRYRKKKETTFTDQNASQDDEGDVLMLEDILPDVEPGPEETMLRKVIWQEIQTALKDMPTEQSQVFVLHEFEELSFKEIAAQMNTSVNTALSRKRYAVLFLRERLQPLYNDLISD